MTTNTLKNEILGACKYCRKFMDTEKKPNPHQCLTYKCSIYDAENCKRTYRIRKKMEQIKTEGEK